MNYVPNIDRRSFLTSAAAVGGGFALGINLPFGPDSAAARGAAPGAWRVGRRQTDDTVVVGWSPRVGQGTSRVSPSLSPKNSKPTVQGYDWHLTPGESIKRERAWGSFSTGGSRGIRESHGYIRQGGASARMMLIQAAANEWKVPPARSRGQERASPQGVEPHHDFRQGDDAAPKLRVPEKAALKDRRLEDRRQAAQAVRRRRQGDRRQTTAPTSNFRACSMRRSRNARSSAAR